MRHHAYTNDPVRDPDHFSDGPLTALPSKLLAFTAFGMFLPVFAFIKPSRRLLPAQMRMSLSVFDDHLKRAAVQQFRFWIVVHSFLLAAILAGFGWEAVLLWYVPARLAAIWLAFIFAWYPHHPADQIGRYVDTRVAVFPGVRYLARGHEYHALHHLFPRVPHYRLRALWHEVGRTWSPRESAPRAELNSPPARSSGDRVRGLCRLVRSRDRTQVTFRPTDPGSRALVRQTRRRF